jgi:WD40 repeat protein
VALSPDGGILAVSEYDGTVRLYNITDPTKPLQALIDAVATGRPLDPYRRAPV